MKVLEIISVIFNLLSIYFLVKQNKLGWLFGIVGIVCYMIIFYNQKLYANTLLQVFFLLQSIWAIFKWNSDTELTIKRIRLDEFLTNHIPGLLLLTCLSYMFVQGVGGYPTISNSFIFALSIYATILMMNRVLENWFFWILNNILLINLFLSSEMYLSVGLYSIFIIMDIKGYVEWKKTLSKELI